MKCTRSRLAAKLLAASAISVIASPALAAGNKVIYKSGAGEWWARYYTAPTVGSPASTYQGEQLIFGAAQSNFVFANINNDAGGLIDNLYEESGNFYLRTWTQNGPNPWDGGLIAGDMTSPFGFGPMSGTGPRPIVAADYNNNGKIDVLYREGDAGAWYAREQGPGAIQPGPDTTLVGSEVVTPFGASQIIVTGDYNNDGRIDVFTADGSDRWRAETMTPGAGGADAVRNNGSTGPAVVLGGASLRKIMVADINNDGLQDFLYRETDGSTWYYRTYSPDNSTPADFTDAIQLQETSLINNANILIGDYNNDGLNDVIFPLGSTYRAWTIRPDNSTGPLYELTDINTGNEFKFIVNYNNQTGAKAWAVDADGNWTTASNWVGGEPNGVGAIAAFGAVITAPRTVTLDAARTVSVINFSNANSYLIVGSNTLTLDTSGGNAVINVLSGSHVIATPVSVAKGLNVAVSNSVDQLTFSNEVSFAASTGLNKSGPGTLAMRNVRADSLAISGGTVRILAQPSPNSTASTSKVASLTVDAGATLDLGNAAMAVDYTGSSPITALRGKVQSAYNSGAWTGTGVTSSAAAGMAVSSYKTAIGMAEASDLYSSFPASFNGQSVDSSSVLLAYTLSGDATLDGKVNTLDFNNLAGYFGGSGYWFNGDFDYNGSINSLDFNALVANYGKTLPSSGPLGSAVPEPASLGMVLLLSGLTRRRRA